MEKSPNCLNCKTFFIDEEPLQLEDLYIEFKNFSEIPVKQPKHRLTLLKTINAFLNTKGGSIFLGVEDNNCRVRGYYISRKQQDEFRFFIKELVSRMHPKVDFSNREEVETVYLPILGKDKKFTGKYIVKIIVKQGRTDAVYTFGERIKLIMNPNNETEEFEIRHAYKRIGAGGLEKMDTVTILEEVYRKAKTANHEYKPHEGCNPRPLEPTFVVKNIGFKGLGQRRLREHLIQLFKMKLKHTPMECEINYDEETQLLLVEFEQENDAETTRDQLVKHLEYLSTEEIELEYMGPNQDSFVFRNKLAEKSNNRRPSAEKNDRSKPQPTKSDSTPSPVAKVEPLKKEKKGFYYAITHINPGSREKLLNFLANHFENHEECKYDLFRNTLLLKVDKQETLQKCHQSIIKLDRKLQEFGHNGRIIYGPSTGHLCIYNYYEKKRNEMKAYIENLFEGKLHGTEFKKDQHDKTRSFIDLKFDHQDAADALDIVLNDGTIRSYNLFSKGREMPKMKFLLICGN